MKVAIVFSVIFVVALASPLPDGVPGHYTNVQDDVGQYALSYVGDRVSHVEQGSLKQVDNAVVLVKRGSYVFIGEDGKKYLTSYVADENGFRPVGDHIPVTE